MIFYFILNLKLYYISNYQIWGLGIGDWGLGIGDWGLGTITNKQTPKPNTQITN